MHRVARTLLPAVALAVGSAVAAPAAQAQYQAYGLVTVGGAQQLVTFNTGAPTNVMMVGNTGAQLTGIDFRPATGRAVRLQRQRRLPPSTSPRARRRRWARDRHDRVGNVAFDFNPTVDRIRLVGADGTNLRLNPITGGVAATDTPYGYAPATPGPARRRCSTRRLHQQRRRPGHRHHALRRRRVARRARLIGLPNGGAGVTSVGTGPRPRRRDWSPASTSSPWGRRTSPSSPPPA
jgi:hypothetical protein